MLNASVPWAGPVTSVKVRVPLSTSVTMTAPVMTVSSLPLTALSSATGASLTGTIVSWKIDAAESPPLSVAVTANPNPMADKLSGGVPEKVPVAGSKAIHDGSGVPLAWVAERVSVASSASRKVPAGTAKLNAVSSAASAPVNGTATTGASLALVTVTAMAWSSNSAPSLARTMTS